MRRTMQRHFYRRSNLFLVSTEGGRVRVHSYSADGATEVHESEGASPGSQNRYSTEPGLKFDSSPSGLCEGLVPSSTSLQGCEVGCQNCL